MSDLIREIDIKLEANNSSGTQNFHIEYHKYSDGDSFFLATLTGKLNDEDIQIDFDEMSLCEINEMIAALTIIRDEHDFLNANPQPPINPKQQDMK